jgi:predicted tellurium resistance membrane protein TerC
MEGEAGDTQKDLKVTSFKGVIFQILLLDLVFSIDSIITAIGMANELWIMYVAVIISVGIMFFASGPISRFVNDHPAFKMLALSFLLLIGVSLIGDGLGMHIPKGYIYFSMGFSLLVNIIQMRSTKRTALPVETKEHYLREEVRKTE